MRIRQFLDHHKASLYCGLSEITIGAHGTSRTEIYTRNLATAQVIARLMQFSSVPPIRAGKYCFTSRLSAARIKEKLAFIYPTNNR